MSLIKGVKVGTTDITATYTDDSTKTDSAELEVTRVSLVSIDSPDDVVYSGSPYTPEPTVRAIVNGVLIELNNGDDYSLSYVDNINAGTATVTATGINNFTGSVSSTWKITEGSIVVTADAQTYEYDGTYHGQAITATALNQDVTIRYGLTENVYDQDTPPSFKDVSSSGYYTVYYQVSAPNYTDVAGSYKVTITPFEAILSWGNSSWRYDGDAHYTTCIVENLIGEDTCTVTLSNNSITNIGSAVVKATALSNINYKLPSTGLEYTISVLSAFFVKAEGAWKSVKRVYKKVSGTWTLTTIDDLYTNANPFNKDDRYVQKA